MPLYSGVPASMGPRQKCLGNGIMPIYEGEESGSFNGAETKMSRKLSVGDKYCRMISMLQWGRDKNVSEINNPKFNELLNMSASMGPRQKCLGN